MADIAMACGVCALWALVKFVIYMYSSSPSSTINFTQYFHIIGTAGTAGKAMILQEDLQCQCITQNSPNLTQSYINNACTPTQSLWGKLIWFEWLHISILCVLQTVNLLLQTTDYHYRLLTTYLPTCILTWSPIPVYDNTCRYINYNSLKAIGILPLLITNN